MDIGDDILDAKTKLDELYKQGARVFSHSKLGTFNTCEYQYYNSYVLEK
jgi:ATP-dependent helicase/DNAse subunit B